MGHGKSLKMVLTVQNKLGRSKFQPAACKKIPAHSCTTFSFSDSHTPIIFTWVCRGSKLRITGSVKEERLELGECIPGDFAPVRPPFAGKIIWMASKF